MTVQGSGEVTEAPKQARVKAACFMAHVILWLYIRVMRWRTMLWDGTLTVPQCI